MKRNDFGLGINNGDRGRVLAVDPERQSLLIESDGRQVRLGRDFLCEPTGRGDPSLLHGYAITCHVAQGVTVDEAHCSPTAASRESSPTPP